MGTVDIVVKLLARVLGDNNYIFIVYLLISLFLSWILLYFPHCVGDITHVTYNTQSHAHMAKNKKSTCICLELHVFNSFILIHTNIKVQLMFNTCTWCDMEYHSRCLYKHMWLLLQASLSARPTHVIQNPKTCYSAPSSPSNTAPIHG